MHSKRNLTDMESTVMQRLNIFQFRILIGTIGLIAAALMLVWLVTSVLGFTVSIIDVFGMEGIRIPAGIAIGGLLLAAAGFNKF